MDLKEAISLIQREKDDTEIFMFDMVAEGHTRAKYLEEVIEAYNFCLKVLRKVEL